MKRAIVLSLPALVMIAGGVGTVVTAHGCYGQRETAEAQARTYLRTTYPLARERTVSCMNVDTDQNGYVSCDAVVDGRALPIECAANAGCIGCVCNEGCKARTVVQIQQGSGQ